MFFDDPYFFRRYDPFDFYASDGFDRGSFAPVSQRARGALDNVRGLRAVSLSTMPERLG